MLCILSTSTKKAKVVPVRVMGAQRGSSGTVPFVLNLSTGQTCMANFSCFTPQETTHYTH